MIRFTDVSVTYSGATRPTLSDVNLFIPEGELALLVGRTGSGKSTLLQAVNGLVPHFTGGTLTGEVTVNGRTTAEHPPRELSDVVGYVPQDPMSGFVTDTVEEELAYGMEAIGIDPATMRRRVEEILDLLGLAELRDRSLLTLSGGQRQRTAIGSVLTTNPSVLILDEPTSALDPGAAEEVLAAISRLVLDLGLTVLMAEHRLERVVGYADRLVVVQDGQVRSGPPGELFADAPVAPPVVELGRQLGWSPLPLSIRDARSASMSWRDAHADSAEATPTAPPIATPGAVVADASDLTVSFGAIDAVQGVDLQLRAGTVRALMGRNGAGKSTLMAALIGLQKPKRGSVKVGSSDPVDPTTLSGADLVRRIGLVPQEAGDLLYRPTVASECASADELVNAEPGSALAILERLAPGINPEIHPRDLSEGQRLSLVLAVVLVSEPEVILLDEPTRGLDYPGKVAFAQILRDLADRGHSILMATHDVELVAEAADEVTIMAEGHIVADGPTAQVVVSSPMFAPQVAKVMRPVPALTVNDAVRLIQGSSQ